MQVFKQLKMLLKYNRTNKEVDRMAIHTIEQDFDYQMEGLMTKFKKDNNLEELDAEELQEKLWGKQGEKNYLTIEFARAVLEMMSNYSGDELFE